MIDLIEYGIHTEKSDIRAHVSVVNRSVYVFQTMEALDVIRRYEPPLRTAFQPGIDFPTAEGWLASIDWFSDLRNLKFYSWPGWDRFADEMTTTEKGALAVECVTALMENARFPIWINAQESGETEIQIAGTDIVVFCNRKVQVKCDWRCGHKPLGTGNLFLQRAERNPLAYH